MNLSTSVFPEIEQLRRRAKTLAMLDAIVCPEWEYRYFSFNAAWSESEEMASMRNGGGDEWFILFGPLGAAMKGFAHESPVAAGDAFAKEIQRVVPVSFSSFLKEPAFSMNLASFCYWRGIQESAWSKVVHPDAEIAQLDDGSAELLKLLLHPKSVYQKFVEDYYEREIELTTIKVIFQHVPLTQAVVKAINPELSLQEAEEFAVEIGYPCVTRE